MIDSVILRDTTKEEWPQIRQRMLNRILDNFGEPPVEMKPIQNKFEELERYKNYGLTHIRIRYEVMESIDAEAVIVLPEGFEDGREYPAVVTIHGSNKKGTYSGKYGMLDPEGKIGRLNRGYGIELAKRGYVTISPDQFGFGTAMQDPVHQEKFEHFYDIYPNWSLSGIRLLCHMRCVDVLMQLGCVKKDAIGTMGNSLGGCAVMYLTAFDERISAAVMSTGISPWVTNIYRELNRPLPTQKLDPQQTAAMIKNGKSPWELSEILSLCAPRPIMCLEPFNDPFNPYTMVSIECVHKAWEVYQLLGSPQKVGLYVHGDGHDTVDEVRRMAYDWFDRFLK